MSRIAPVATRFRTLATALAAAATIVVGACSSAENGGDDTPPDADVPGTDGTPAPDAGVPCTATPREAIETTCDGVDNDCDGTADNVANPPPWYVDGDGDGAGGGSAVRFGCAQPAGHVATAADCNDSDPAVNPGARETCDGLDNDCNAGTVEACGHSCQVRVNTTFGKRYLFCNEGQTWAVARTLCMAEGFDLAIVGDDAENTWLDSTGGAISDGDWWIGAGDAIAEDTWIWVDGTPFWQGRSNGAAVEGRHSEWASNEPNNDGEEDCGELRENGTWNDNKCSVAQRFICER